MAFSSIEKTGRAQALLAPINSGDNDAHRSSFLNDCDFTAVFRECAPTWRRSLKRRGSWNSRRVRAVRCSHAGGKDRFLLDSQLLRFQIVFLFQCRGGPMSISIAHIQPIVALIAGVLILIMPRLLNFIVAIYLILVGIIGWGLLSNGIFQIVTIGRNAGISSFL
jgi:hypothetical protein